MDRRSVYFWGGIDRVWQNQKLPKGLLATGPLISFMSNFSIQHKRWPMGFSNNMMCYSWLVQPGLGRPHLAMAFAINEVLQKRKKKVVLTRPVMEAGENLGFLPGELENKVYPYMLPLHDCMDRLVGEQGPQKESIEKSIELCPLAYMRGRTFYNSVCILDEAQNATEKQLKMFLTRFGEGSKIIITGDPKQSDLTEKAVPLVNVVNRLESVPGIGIVRFKEDSVVRHPLVSAILNKLEE